MLKKDLLGYLDFGTTAMRPPAPRRVDETAIAGRTKPRASTWLARFVEALGGRLEDGPEGSRLIARRWHEGSDVHAGRRLADFLAVRREMLGWLGRDPALAGIDLRRAAFVDCETTGLAGGTGTKAFLVGIARFDEGIGGERLAVEQHFLPDYDVEGAFLAGVDAALARASCLVTFNGKRFDLPLLETRLALHRRRVDWLDLPHLDLLHPARRLWRRRLESCGLASLEEHVLGLARADDVPGWLIPSLYFDFLRSGDLTPLEQVFEHNRLDLLGMIALAARLGRLLSGEDEPAHPLDHYSLAREMESLGEVERGIAHYERALGGNLLPAERDEVQAKLGLLYKRARLDDRALAAWDAIAWRHGSRSVFGLVELAKHCEHRARDYARAAEVTRRALRVVALRPEAAGASQEATMPALERRLRRLEGRLRVGWREKPPFEDGSK